MKCTFRMRNRRLYQNARVGIASVVGRSLGRHAGVEMCNRNCRLRPNRMHNEPWVERQRSPNGSPDRQKCNKTVINRAIGARAVVVVASLSGTTGNVQCPSTDEMPATKT